MLDTIAAVRHIRTCYNGLLVDGLLVGGLEIFKHQLGCVDAAGGVGNPVLIRIPIRGVACSRVAKVDCKDPILAQRLGHKLKRFGVGLIQDFLGVKAPIAHRKFSRSTMRIDLVY